MFYRHLIVNSELEAVGESVVAVLGVHSGHAPSTKFASLAVRKCMAAQHLKPTAVLPHVWVQPTATG